MGSRHVNKFENLSFTEMQMNVIQMMFNTLDDDGAGFVDLRNLLTEYEQKSKERKGELHDLLDILRRAEGNVSGHMLDIEAFGDTFEAVKLEKKAKFDTFLGILSAKIVEAREDTIHIGDRPVFNDEEKLNMQEVFRFLDRYDDGKFDVDSICRELGTEAENLETLERFFIDLRLEGTQTMKSYVQACWAFKHKSQQGTQLFDLLYDFHPKIRDMIDEAQPVKQQQPEQSSPKRKQFKAKSPKSPFSPQSQATTSPLSSPALSPSGHRGSKRADKLNKAIMRRTSQNLSPIPQPPPRSPRKSRISASLNRKPPPPPPKTRTSMSRINTHATTSPTTSTAMSSKISPAPPGSPPGSPPPPVVEEEEV